MAKVTLKLKGLETVVKAIESRKGEIQQVIDDSLQTFAVLTVAEAKQRAPVNFGLLRNSIAWVLEPLKARITVNVDYAAYQEFGTGKYARAYVPTLPAEWRELAAQFKGKNIEGGIPAAKYIVPAVENNQEKLIKNLKAQL